MPGAMTSGVPPSPHCASPVLASLSPGLKESLETRKNKSIDSFLICTFPVESLANFIVYIQTLRWKIYDWRSFGCGRGAASFCSNALGSISCHRVRDQERKCCIISSFTEPFLMAVLLEKQCITQTGQLRNQILSLLIILIKKKELIL